MPPATLQSPKRKPLRRPKPIYPFFRRSIEHFTRSILIWAFSHYLVPRILGALYFLAVGSPFPEWLFHISPISCSQYLVLLEVQLTFAFYTLGYSYITASLEYDREKEKRDREETEWEESHGYDLGAGDDSNSDNDGDSDSDDDAGPQNINDPRLSRLDKIKIVSEDLGLIPSTRQDTYVCMVIRDFLVYLVRFVIIPLFFLGNSFIFSLFLPLFPSFLLRFSLPFSFPTFPTLSTYIFKPTIYMLTYRPTHCLLYLLPSPPPPITLLQYLPLHFLPSLFLCLISLIHCPSPHSEIEITLSRTDPSSIRYRIPVLSPFDDYYTFVGPYTLRETVRLCWSHEKMIDAAVRDYEDHWLER
ncbi:hypothetical protein MKZ38_008046 [Zalerion maritima]|uniref:Uncharacterized protein n=1 Tax=Zalerion maritima TaxID=339359 RepID=A0AAD5RHJ3_9PEZI|nr:hypothetical protein MKZ38_008046 [Zalerion maritima]